MKVRTGSLASACVIIVALGWAAVSAYRAAFSDKTGSKGSNAVDLAGSKAPRNSEIHKDAQKFRKAQARAMQPEEPIEERAHGAREGDEPENNESRLFAEWDEMTSEQRRDEAVGEFRRSLRAAVDHRSAAELESAATMLSALRPELYATDAGRAEYDRLEAEYDDVERELDGSR